MWIDAFVEHLVHLLGDRHLDLQRARLLVDRERGGEALDLLTDGLARRRDAFAARQRQSEAAIARLIVGTGQGQITDAGESHEGIAFRAEGKTQAANLRQPAGDQRRAGVRAETQAVGDTRRDRHHVLTRAADLDADHVIADIRAEGLRVHAPGELRRAPGIARRDRDRGRQTTRHLHREGRPGEHSEPCRLTELLGRHLVQQLAGALLQSLGRPAQAGLFVQQRLQLAQHATKSMAGHDHQHLDGTGKRGT